MQAKSVLSATGGVRVVDNAASDDGGGVLVRDATLSFADGAEVSLPSTLSALPIFSVLSTLPTFSVPCRQCSFSQQHPHAPLGHPKP